MTAFRAKSTDDGPFPPDTIVTYHPIDFTYDQRSLLVVGLPDGAVSGTSMPWAWADCNDGVWSNHYTKQPLDFIPTHYRRPFT